LVKFRGGHDLISSLNEWPDDPFAATAVHFLNVLCLRTTIIEHVGVGGFFTLAQAADACGGDDYAALMTLGQMIKVGLVDFDTTRPWDHRSQRYICRREANKIV
jgi:hypothetical protein